MGSFIKKRSMFVFFSVIVFILIIFVAKNTIKVKKTDVNNDVIYIGTYEKSIVKSNNYVFTGYDDYYKKFRSSKLSKKDFKTNNYVLISIYYNSCLESDFKLDNYTISSNVINVLFKYNKICSSCSNYKYRYYLLKVDKNIKEVKLNTDYKLMNNLTCENDIIVKKPIIYLYPKEETEVSVKLSKSENIITSYPKYEEEWKVISYPDGSLIDKKTQRKLYGLYYEANLNSNVNFKDGFVVSRDDTISFLEEKLQILGLTEKEADEFIIYWLPKLEENKYNLIRFETQEKINELMPLIVNPSPDTIIRIYMQYKPLYEKINIKEQKLSSISREGFTLVEWGGSLIK